MNDGDAVFELLTFDYTSLCGDEKKPVMRVVALDFPKCRIA
jgi:hypothetical protein